MNVILDRPDAITAAPGLNCTTNSFLMSCRLVIVEGQVIGVRLGGDGTYHVLNDHAMHGPVA